MTPTARSLAYLRDAGWAVDIVERFVGPARVRKDLFGMFDLLAVRGNETLAVQVTSSGVAARVRKITESPLLAAVRGAGWVIRVHGWTKRANGRYALREVDLS